MKALLVAALLALVPGFAQIQAEHLPSLATTRELFNSGAVCLVRMLDRLTP